jgi:hypothetical protein
LALASLLSQEILERPHDDTKNEHQGVLQLPATGKHFFLKQGSEDGLFLPPILTDPNDLCSKKT